MEKVKVKFLLRYGVVLVKKDTVWLSNLLTLFWLTTMNLCCQRNGEDTHLFHYIKTKVMLNYVKNY